MRKALADLQPRPDVSSRAMVRAGGTFVTALGRTYLSTSLVRLRIAITSRIDPPSRVNPCAA